jgi:DNA polymerase-1
MKTLLIDGNNAVWRCAMKMPELTTPRGENIQVVYGVIRLLRDMIDRFEPNQVIVCWDEGVPAYRLSIYPNYKQHRERHRMESTEKAKENRKKVLKQMSTLKEILPLLGVKQVSHPNTEGDDLIGTAAQMKRLGMRIIISGDKDMFQLVKKGVRVWNPNHLRLYKHSNFEKIMEITPAQYADIQILTGDMQGDGIPPAAKGLGDKTAKELIQKYGSLVALFQKPHRKKIKKMGSRYAKLYKKGVREQILVNWKLTDLITVNNQKALETLIKLQAEKKVKVDPHKVRQAFMNKAFVSLLKDFGAWILPFQNLS